MIGVNGETGNDIEKSGLRIISNEDGMNWNGTGRRNKTGRTGT